MHLAAHGLAIRRGPRLVLSGVDLDLAPGALIGLIGPNGAGKSSLLKALAGLLSPEAGRIEIGGRALGRVPARERARLIAYLPQGGTVAWPLTVEALVGLARLPHRPILGKPSPVEHAAVRAALARVDALDFIHRDALQLSAGERARVLLARALAVDAPVLIADEPTAALDPRHQLDVMALLKAEAGRGRVVIVALHELSLAERFCDGLVLLASGGVAARGTAAHVLTAENLATAFAIRAQRLAAGAESVLVPWASLPLTAGPDPDTGS